MRQNPHVRICGGLGSATTLVYPTPWPRWPRIAGVVLQLWPAAAGSLKRS